MKRFFGIPLFQFWKSGPGRLNQIWNKFWGRATSIWLVWSSQFSGRWSTLIFGLVFAAGVGGIASWNLLIGLALGLLLLLLIWLLPRPILIVYLVIAAYPFTGGLERGGVVPGLRVAQLMLAVAFFLFFFSRPCPQGKSRLSLLDLAFAFTLVTSSVLPLLAVYFRGDTIGEDSGYGQTPFQLLVGPLQYYLLYRMVVSVISNAHQIKVILGILFSTSIIVSILGILQKIGIGPVRDFLDANYPMPSAGIEITDLNQRITSTLVNWAALGAYLCVTLLLVIACYVNQNRIKMPGVLLALTLVFDMVALVLTGTMVAWLSLIICGALIFKLSNKMPSPKVLIQGGVGIVFSIILFLPFLQNRLDEQVGAGASNSILPASIDFRVRAWTQIFLPAIGENLAFGEGPSPKELNYWPTEESQYLFLLLRGGLPNLISYILLMAVGFNVCRRIIRGKTSGVEYPVAIGTFVILIAINIMNLTAVYFTAFGATQIIWILLGIVVAFAQLQVIGSWDNADLIEGTATVVNIRRLPAGIKTYLPSPVRALPAKARADEESLNEAT